MEKTWEYPALRGFASKKSTDKYDYLSIKKISSILVGLIHTIWRSYRWLTKIVYLMNF
jgi:hypothetical protein